MKAFAFALALALSTLSITPAQAEIITIGGEKYDCTKLDSDGSCWDKCPWSFDTCASSCGGGSDCWDKCPWSFDTCAGTCGGGSSCWDACPWSFDTCKNTCGTKDMPAKDAFEASMPERLLRLEKARDFQFQMLKAK